MIAGTGPIEATDGTLGQHRETLCPSFRDRFTDRTTSPPPQKEGDIACNNRGGGMLITEDLCVVTLLDVS